MNAEKYPLINVLNAFRGFHNNKLPYHITPIRFMKQNGETFRVAEIRHFHKDRKGRGQHFHYILKTKNSRYFRILFDTNSFTWRLIEELKRE
jgi:hypothetical protein